MGKTLLMMKKETGTIASESAKAHMILSWMEISFLESPCPDRWSKKTYDHTKPGTNITNIVPSIISTKSAGFTLP